MSVPSDNGSSRAQKLFTSIKRLSSNDLGYLARLIAEDKVLFDCIFLKSQHALDEVAVLTKIKELAACAEKEHSDQVDKFAEILNELTSRMRSRNAGKRYQNRDDEIVRLYDVEDKTFGEIPAQLLLLNPKWCRNGGGPITRDAAEKAYHRRKEPGQTTLSAPTK